MATLLEDIVTFLIDQGAVQGDGVDIFRDYSPDKPDTAIVLYEYMGGPITIGIDVSNRRVQISNRALSATTAKETSWKLYNILNTPITPIRWLTPIRWATIVAQQAPFKLDVDTNKRVIYGFNITIIATND